MNTFISNVDLKLKIAHTEIKINKFYFFNERQNTKNHTHSHIEIHYITRGKSIFCIDFTKNITVEEKGIIILGKNVYHDEKIIDNCSGYCFGIEILDYPGYEEESIFNLLNKSVFFNKENQTQIGELLYDIMNEYMQKKEGYTEYCKNLFSLVLLNISRLYSSENRKKDSYQPQKSENNRLIIDDFFNRIFDYQTDNFTSEALAKKLFLSKRHLNRLLHEYYNMSFNQLLIHKKMEFVRYLLLNTDKSVEEISDMCGYTSTYLIRCFKNEYIITPYKYKKIVQKGHDC